MGNHGVGPLLIDVLEASLVRLFGRAQYDRVRADVVAGKDSYFNVPPAVLAAYEQEEAWAAANAVPQPRRMLPVLA